MYEYEVYDEAGSKNHGWFAVGTLYATLLAVVLFVVGIAIGRVSVEQELPTRKYDVDILFTQKGLNKMMIQVELQVDPEDREGFEALKALEEHIKKFPARSVQVQRGK